MGPLPLDEMIDVDHVAGRNALGNAYDDLDSGVGGFQNGVRSKWRRHENHRCVGPFIPDRLGDRIEHRPIEMARSALAGRDASDQACAVLDHLLGVEGALPTGESLHDETRVLVNQNAHS